MILGLILTRKLARPKPATVNVSNASVAILGGNKAGSSSVLVLVSLDSVAVCIWSPKSHSTVRNPIRLLRTTIVLFSI